MLGEILANFGGIGHLAGEVTQVVQPIITSSDWDVVATTATETAKAAIMPALGIMTIVVGVPVAKKVFRKVSN